MILKSETDQVYFELQLLAYQFPANDYDGWDANWLLVSVRIESRIASWHRTDPCLITGEAHQLASWLGDVALDRDTRARLDFLEPNLSFELVGRDAGMCDLRLYFAAECRPPGIPAEREGDEFFIPLRVGAGELREAANQLCRELRQYPIRAQGWGHECREV